MIDWVIEAAEWVGVVAFAAAGAMIAAERRMDLFGILFLAGITALGGGVIRDVLLGVIPPVMFYSYGYLTCAAAVGLVIFLLIRLFRGFYVRERDRVNRLINLLDAIGLGVFAVLGTQSAMDAGYADNWFMVIFLGVTSGIGGGVLRDVMVGRVPFVLRKYVYAVAAIAGCLCHCILLKCGVNPAVSLIVSMLLVTVLRVLSTVFRWRMPRALKEEKNNS